MTELLQKAMEKAHSLPTEMQDAIARMVLTYADRDQPPVNPAPKRDGQQARTVDFTKIDAITRRSANRPLVDNRSSRDILADAWGEPA